MDFIFRCPDGSHVPIDTVHPSLFLFIWSSSHRWYHLQCLSSDVRILGLVSSRFHTNTTFILRSKKVAKNDLSVQLEFQVMSFQSYICSLNLVSFQYLMTTLIRPCFLLTIYDCGFVRFCLQRNTLAVVTFIVVATTADHAIAIYVATCKLSSDNRAIHR